MEARKRKRIEGYDGLYVDTTVALRRDEISNVWVDSDGCNWICCNGLEHYLNVPRDATRLWLQVVPEPSEHAVALRLRDCVLPWRLKHIDGRYTKRYVWQEFGIWLGNLGAFREDVYLEIFYR